MKLPLTVMVLVLAASLASPRSACSGDSPYSLVKTTRITFAKGMSRTTRANGRCICSDAAGRVHIVWEDKRSGNLEVYYASIVGDSLCPAMRITRSRNESSYPCVACDSEDVYILWEEVVGQVSDLFYVRLRDGDEVARKRITRTNLDSSCPVSAMGPDGTVHIAWHEGPFKQTAVYYGKIVADSLVATQRLSLEDPEAFRPDIACDAQGGILVAWFEGLDVKARLWHGTAWQKEALVATNNSRPWRLSVADLSDGTWALAWFDKTDQGSDVLVKFYDGKEWYGRTDISVAKVGYYPNIASLGPGELVAVWEENDMDAEQYAIGLRCYDGKAWSKPIDLYREAVAGRYPSVVGQGDRLHAVWFSAKTGNDEIFYALLRSR